MFWIAVDDDTDDSGKDFEAKQYKEDSEDRSGSTVHCPYAEDHHDCRYHYAGSFFRDWVA